MAIELVPLYTARVQLATSGPHVLEKTPAGTRLIFEVVGGEIEGDRIRATVKGAAGADWFLMGPDGTGTLDVRATVETDDGALIYVHYLGRSTTDADGVSCIYTAPLFETGDDRYRWLNRIQAVAKGSLADNVVSYEAYEVR
jgi:hypothetical protein